MPLWGVSYGFALLLLLWEMENLVWKNVGSDN